MAITPSARASRVQALHLALAQCLGPSKLSSDERLLLAAELEYSDRLRARGVMRLATHDIVTLAEEARDGGDANEAIWRAFVGAHFGRLSARGENAKSAGLFLCAFGDSPRWTWQAVLSDEKAFLGWVGTEPKLKTLRFGNHRKHENIPQLRKVFSELIKFIKRFASLPTVAIKTPGASSPEERFDALMEKVDTYRFGRLGNFDLIDLLVQLGLVVAEPAHCYLAGASGPRDGAVAVWGDIEDAKLDELAKGVARHLKLSCFVVEDALCNFSKDGDSCCGDPEAADCERTG